ncbi:MAG TPA: ester cyclase [Niastella sp.]|nr:ester cyclase [Niastella sp.]
MKQIIIAAFTALCFTACNDSATTATTASDADSTKMNTTNAADSKDTKEERNKQIIEASMKGVENGNVDEIFKDAAPDMVDYGDGSMKPMKVDSVKAFLKSYMAAIPDYKGSDLTMVADGDNVMVYGTWTGTWKNDMMGAKATGKSFKVNDVDFFKLNDDGKITEHRSVMPMSEISRQIGMKMPAQ